MKDVYKRQVEYLDIADSAASVAAMESGEIDAVSYTHLDVYKRQAVINASLYGVVEEAKSSGSIGRVYGAIGGSEGILKENFLELMQYPDEKLSLLLQTPATAIGSSRYALKQEDYNAMAGIFRKYGIRYVLLNGGNGTMDTCGRIFEACRGEDIYVVGIPKTIDLSLIHI